MGFWRASSSTMWAKIVASSTSLSTDTTEVNHTNPEADLLGISLPAITGTVRVAFQIKNGTAAKAANWFLYALYGDTWTQIETGNYTGTTYVERTVDVKVYVPHQPLKITGYSAIGGTIYVKNVEIRGTITDVESDSQAEQAVVFDLT